MKNILFIHGSPRRGETFRVVQLFVDELKRFFEFKEEHLYLVDEKLEYCRGCLSCIQFGEEKCPIKDNLAKIYNQMLNADAIVFTSPVHALQVSGLFKNFVDRIAFAFHRPCFFGKHSISIVTQGILGYKGVLKYMDSIADFWGFKTVKGIAVTTPPGFRSEREKALIDEEIKKGALRFSEAINLSKPKKVRLSSLMQFRFTRSMISTRSMIDDYFNQMMPKKIMYYKEKGWITSDFYYDVKLSVFQKIVGRYFDHLGKKYAEKKLKERLKEERQN